VEILADFLRGYDAYGGGQQRVHAALNFLGVERGVGFEMRDLTERVNSGIGAAGAVDGDWLLRDLADGDV
jgi:hypothetical protein